MRKKEKKKSDLGQREICNLDKSSVFPFLGYMGAFSNSM